MLHGFHSARYLGPGNSKTGKTRFHLNNDHTGAVKTKSGLDGAAVAQQQAPPEYAGETRGEQEQHKSNTRDHLPISWLSPRMCLALGWLWAALPCLSVFSILHSAFALWWLSPPTDPAAWATHPLRLPEAVKRPPSLPTDRSACPAAGPGRRCCSGRAAQSAHAEWPFLAMVGSRSRFT
jgi:hypothetical protein